MRDFRKLEIWTESVILAKKYTRLAIGFPVRKSTGCVRK